MWQQPRPYPFLAVIEYNTRPVVPGRGSGIFLHAQTGGPTIGCISLRKPELRAVLRWLRPADAPVIAIGTREATPQLERRVVLVEVLAVPRLVRDRVAQLPREPLVLLRHPRRCPPTLCCPRERLVRNCDVPVPRPLAPPVRTTR